MTWLLKFSESDSLHASIKQHTINTIADKVYPDHAQEGNDLPNKGILMKLQKKTWRTQITEARFSEKYLEFQLHVIPTLYMVYNSLKRPMVQYIILDYRVHGMLDNI